MYMYSFAKGFRCRQLPVHWSCSHGLHYDMLQVCRRLPLPFFSFGILLRELSLLSKTVGAQQGHRKDLFAALRRLATASVRWKVGLRGRMTALVLEPPGEAHDWLSRVRALSRGFAEW